VIAEALAWLATPAPWAARRLGYLYEAVAITARYRRCRAAAVAGGGLSPIVRGHPLFLNPAAMPLIGHI
jgi:hypothetical protein